MAEVLLTAAAVEARVSALVGAGAVPGPGEADPFDVSIIRDTIKLTAVRTRIQGDTVVLRVTTFNDQTYANLESGLEEKIEEVTIKKLKLSLKDQMQEIIRRSTS